MRAVKPVRKWLRIVCGLSVCAALALGVSGCGPINVPPVSLYTIGSLHGINVPTSSRSKSTLMVSAIEASAGYQSSQMLYVSVPFKLRAFANHAWVAPPAQMLLPLIAQRIRARGYFKAVMTPPFTSYTTYRLELRLLTLEQDFLAPTSVVRLVMMGTLVSSVSNQVIASRRFSVTVAAPGNDPYSGVVAANAAATRLSKQIAQFVVQKTS